MYVLGLFIAAFGVAFAINAMLGLTPMNSFPYVLSYLTGVYMGIMVTSLLLLYIVIQIILLRKDFQWIQVTQIICSFMFGYFVDFTIFLLGDFRIPTYFGQLALLAISTVCVSMGITLFMSAKLVPLPSEGLVAAISQKLPKAKFHRVMIVVQVSVVSMGALLSFLILGRIVGVREGTFISAVLVGKLIPFNRKIISPMLKKMGIASIE